MVVDGFTRKNKVAMEDSDYEANRSIIIRVICDSRNRDDDVYRRSGEIHQGELNFILLPGIETLNLSPSTEPPNKERTQLSKGITTLYRVITSLSLNRVTDSSVNWHITKLLHYMQGALLPTSSTTIISLINPLRSHQQASLSSLALCHRVRKIHQTPKPWKIQNKTVVISYLKEQLKKSEERVKENEERVKESEERVKENEERVRQSEARMKELAEELQIKSEAFDRVSMSLDLMNEQEKTASEAKLEAEKQVAELQKRLEEMEESSVLQAKLSSIIFRSLPLAF